MYIASHRSPIGRYALNSPLTHRFLRSGLLGRSRTIRQLRGPLQRVATSCLIVAFLPMQSAQSAVQIPSLMVALPTSPARPAVANSVCLVSLRAT